MSDSTSSSENSSMPLAMLRQFLKLEATSGLILIFAAVVAMICANAPGLAALYQAFLEVPIEVKVGPLELNKNLLLVINDGLMAIFFLLVGLEIKREILEGQLSRRSQIVLPAAGAIGGVALPALFYVMVNRGDAAAMNGWAIPAATDIAFSLGVLALLGSRVPLSLKVFLTTVAVVDDLAAILIIAMFYTANLSLPALAFAGVGVVVLIVLNRMGVSSLGGYFFVGVLMWVALIKSGVHATLAGVVLGFVIPIAGTDDEGQTFSPLRNLEHDLHPWVAYFIMPLFAFANAGVSLEGVSPQLLFEGVGLGILLGLTVGKALGVFSVAGLLVVLGLARLPERSNWGSFFGVSCLAGIGFTMSLFIGTLAFDEQGLSYQVATRLGVFAGSIIAAVVGVIVLAISLPRSPQSGSGQAA